MGDLKLCVCLRLLNVFVSQGSCCLPLTYQDRIILERNRFVLSSISPDVFGRVQSVIGVRRHNVKPFVYF